MNVITCPIRRSQVAVLATLIRRYAAIVSRTETRGAPHGRRMLPQHKKTLSVLQSDLQSLVTGEKSIMELSHDTRNMLQIGTAGLVLHFA